MIPEITDSDVIKLVDQLGTNTIPVYINVEPESYTKVSECFLNVMEKVNRDGGSQCLGWQIWKTDIIVEAEFHAVWKSPSGELQDITKKQIPVHRIMFLPDPEATYIGSSIDNIRVNITQNRLVDDFIELSKAIFRIKNKGDRAFEEEIVLSRKEAHILDTFQRMSVEVNIMAIEGLTRNSPCFCQSGKKYKYCHGTDLTNVLKRI